MTIRGLRETCATSELDCHGIISGARQKLEDILVHRSLEMRTNPGNSD
jgi:hypothetical protein